MFMNNNAAVAAAFVNAFKCVAENQQIMPFGSTSKGNSLFSTKMDGGKNPTADSYLLNGFFDSKEATEENKTGQISRLSVLGVSLCRCLICCCQAYII